MAYDLAMIRITDLTTSQLNQIISIKEQIEKLQSQLDSIGGENSPSSKVAVKATGRRRMSAAARARIAAGARARWAKVRGTTPTAPKLGKKRRQLSAAGRAAIIAGTKARWAKLRGTTAAPKAAKKKSDRRMSPEVKARLAAIAKARWANVKAAGKTAL
ncbi:MAG TPA: hypothetical protein VH595_05335 [Verrucomicrobiae bacterium]|jgi:hypothetical protein|nr:hypothetical protein [Verrucomicrobiae bacterium]